MGLLPVSSVHPESQETGPAENPHCSLLCVTLGRGKVSSAVTQLSTHVHSYNSKMSPDSDAGMLKPCECTPLAVFVQRRGI